jgi:hypothetical protein
MTGGENDDVEFSGRTARKSQPRASPAGRPSAAAGARAAQAPVSPGELMSACSALLLLICMFALAWFGTVGRAGRTTGVGLQGSEDAWNALTITRWPMLLTILASFAALVLHATQRSHGSKTETGMVLLVLSVPTAALVFVRALIDLPDPERVVDQKLGAYLGVLFAVGVAVGAWRSLLDARDARRARAPRRRGVRVPRAEQPR